MMFPRNLKDFFSSSIIHMSQNNNKKNGRYLLKTHRKRKDHVITWEDISYWDFQEILMIEYLKKRTRK